MIDTTPLTALNAGRYMAILSHVGTIGENVKRLREGAGHTHQGKFARKIGKTQQWLSDVENGRVDNPDTDGLIAIAKGIPCSIELLVDGTHGYVAGAQGIDEAVSLQTFALKIRMLREYAVGMTAVVHDLAIIARLPDGSESTPQSESATPATKRRSRRGH